MTGQLLIMERIPAAVVASPYAISEQAVMELQSWPPVHCPKVSRARVTEDVHQWDPGGTKSCQHPQLGIYHLGGTPCLPPHFGPWCWFWQVAEGLHGDGLSSGSSWNHSFAGTGSAVLWIANCVTRGEKTTFLWLAVFLAPPWRWQFLPKKTFVN